MHDRWRSVGWAVLLVAVISWVFHESLFRRFTLVPTDILYSLILPYASVGGPVSVKNHYVIDALTEDYPWGVFWQQTVKAGQLPLWNPYILGGHPFLADSMPAVLSPFKLLYLVVSAERAFTLGIVMQFALASLFMFVLLRELGRSRPASFIGACAWALNSSLLMSYFKLPGVFCWAPSVLLLLERSIRNASWRYTLAAALALGIAFLSGNIQAGSHLAFLSAWYGGCLTLAQEPVDRARTLARVTTVLVAGGLLAAATWLPTLELVRLDVYGGAEARGVHMSLRHTLLGIPALVTFAFPALTGSTETFDLLKLAAASRADFTGYIGLVPFTLFVVGALISPEKRVRGVLWMMAAMLGLVFLTPLVKYLYHRFFVIAAFGLAFGAAYGADIVLESRPESTTRIRRILEVMMIVCGLIAVGLVGFRGLMFWKGAALTAKAQQYIARQAHTGAFSYRRDWFAERVHGFFANYSLSNVEFWLPLSSVLLVGVAWSARQRGRIGTPALALTLMTFSVADITISGRRLLPQCDLEKYPLQPRSTVLKPLESDRDLFRVHRSRQSAEYVFRPDWLMCYSVYDLEGNFSLAPESLEWLVYQTNNQLNGVLDLVNVRYVITEKTASLPAGRFDLVSEADGLRLYRNPRCRPRLQFYQHWQVIPDRQKILELTSADSFNPAETVYLEQTPTLAPFPANAPAGTDIEQYTPNRVVAWVSAPHAGILLLADTWYPGWKARVDGHPAPLYRADRVLRATEVPAGEHRVEFYYAPLSLRIGAAISLGTLAVLLLGLAIPNRTGNA